MKNKEKYNLAHLHIVERAGTTRLDGYITYIEIEYSGKIVKEYACTNEAGIKNFLNGWKKMMKKDANIQFLQIKKRLIYQQLSSRLGKK